MNGVGQRTGLVSGHLFPRWGFDWHDRWMGVEPPDTPSLGSLAFLRVLALAERAPTLGGCIGVVADA